MSLLKCIECGKDISEYAERCPNCGYPMSLVKANKVVEGYCNINGVLCSKEEIRTMIKEDTIYKFLLHECKLSGGEAWHFIDVIEFNNNEIPDNYYECYEQMLAELKAKTDKSKKSKVHCKYCGSTNVKELGYFDGGWKATYGGLQWHCNSCGSDF